VASIMRTFVKRTFVMSGSFREGIASTDRPFCRSITGRSGGVKSRGDKAPPGRAPFFSKATGLRSLSALPSLALVAAGIVMRPERGALARTGFLSFEA
jgi:hypothetical protein